MSSLRVFHLADARTWRGGEQQVLYLHRGLLARGVDSTVLCARGGVFHQRLAAEGLPHRPLDLRGPFDLVSALRVGRWARREGAVVHTHTSHAHGLALLATYLGGRFPLVVSRRVDFPVATGPSGRWKYHSDRVDLYLAISHGVREVLIGGGVDPAKIRLVPSGVDLGRFEGVRPREGWRQELGVPPHRLLLGQVAALAPHKDQATLLRAFARLLQRGVDADLVILGEGELRGGLTALRDELGLAGRVHLPGFTDDVLPRMACFDVFVLSSHLEGLGTAILDAMALGLPVVATRTGGIPDAVEDGVTGRLAPPGDPEALAAALAEVAGDADLRRRRGEAGRHKVAETFDVERTVEKTLAAYGEVVGEEARTAPVEEGPRIYQHTRTRTPLLAALLPALLAATLGLITSEAKTPWLVVALLGAFALLLLHSRTVQVDAEGLELRLGNGWIHRRVPHHRIRACERPSTAVSRRGLWAWPGDGEAVVQVHLREEARPLRIATDEPEVVLAALRRWSRSGEDG